MSQTPDTEAPTPDERRQGDDEFAREVSARLTRLINTDPEFRLLLGLPATSRPKRRRRRREPDAPPRPRRPKPQEA